MMRVEAIPAGVSLRKRRCAFRIWNGVNMKWCGLVAIVLVHMAAMTALASAQEPASNPEVIRLWPGTPPGTTDWTGPETSDAYKLPDGGSVRTVSNVTTPTLLAYRPAPGTGNGTAVIVCPGGGFTELAIEHEGEMVARWLAERGITAFVLKYRVHPGPAIVYPVNKQQMVEMFAKRQRTKQARRRIAIIDGIQAMHYVRANAGRFAIAPDRVGMMGFSAGALTTMGVVLDSTSADRPNFAAPIYGAMIEDKVPSKDAPPLFIALAQDDELVPTQESLKIYSRWTDANLPAELHIYAKGGHGFGMVKQNLPVDHWTEAFEAWLKAGGWMGGQPAPAAVTK